ncbi:hypothetical protein COU57_05240 [Candidatus Pacearchaeota archaeon CG10_big_fil_rev_8_21_14_0_10_32_14]|nr:MAG: hypothetical protein COU57_05240 [Candidatus Pacearchaeota archaeon CG10_big_fil_rev_8_21_14_0_10_32_14]
MRSKVIIFNVDGNVVYSTDFNDIIPLLFNKRYRMLLISDKGQKSIEDFLTKNELHDYFEYIPSSESVMINFEEVASYFNTNPEMMVMVGKENDMIIAKKFGVNFIGVGSSKEEKEILDKCGCMIILNSVADLT